MNNSQNYLAPQGNATPFNSLVTSNLIFADGRTAQIATFLPRGVFFEDCVVWLNQGLEQHENVVSVQHEISSLLATKEIQHFAHYHPHDCTKVFKG